MIPSKLLFFNTQKFLHDIPSTYWNTKTALVIIRLVIHHVFKVIQTKHDHSVRTQLTCFATLPSQDHATITPIHKSSQLIVGLTLPLDRLACTRLGNRRPEVDASRNTTLTFNMCLWGLLAVTALGAVTSQMGEQMLEIIISEFRRMCVLAAFRSVLFLLKLLFIFFI